MNFFHNQKDLFILMLLSGGRGCVVVAGGGLVVITVVTSFFPIVNLLSSSECNNFSLARFVKVNIPSVSGKDLSHF